MNYKRLYIPNGLIFLTIVTNNRIPILTDNIDIICKVTQNVSKYYNFEIFAYSVMPDHIHCIIKSEPIKNYPKIVKSFKYSFTKNVGLVKPTYKRLWQNRYWEHTIRNENDLYKHLDYIHYNCVKHYDIAPKEWKYSSFKSFVTNGYYEKEWYNVDDKYNICNLNYE